MQPVLDPVGVGQRETNNIFLTIGGPMMHSPARTLAFSRLHLEISFDKPETSLLGDVAPVDS